LKVFVISLKDSTTRRENARAQLDRAGVPFEFFDGVRGDTALQQYFNGYDETEFVLNTGRYVTPGEIGCYASHLAMWRKCIELDEAIMIMEDDFLLDERFADAFGIVAARTADLGYIRLQSETKGKKRLAEQFGTFRLWRYTRYPHSAMCYGIAPAVAKTFISSSAILTAPIDVHVKKFWEHSHLMYGLTPYTVTESEASNESTIQSRDKAKKPLLIRVRRVLRKLNWFLQRVRFNLAHPNPS